LEWCHLLKAGFAGLGLAGQLQRKMQQHMLAADGVWLVKTGAAGVHSGHYHHMHSVMVCGVCAAMPYAAAVLVHCLQFWQQDSHWQGASGYRSIVT
jgi:hypothetical protein